MLATPVYGVAPTAISLHEKGHLPSPTALLADIVVTPRVNENTQFDVSFFPFSVPVSVVVRLVDVETLSRL